MCGRFSLTADPSQLRQIFPWLIIPDEVQPRYNIAPSQPVLAVPNDGNDRLDYFTWGLIPFWAKDPKIGNRMINARAETLHEKPFFKTSFRLKRCLILADGFYEWKREPGSQSKTPVYIKLDSSKPFGFAGLWDIWQSPDGSSIPSCTIITTEPNELLQDIHNRMPVILSKEDYSLWLDPDEQDLNRLKEILRPYPASEMIAYPVSRQVNNPANDNAACIQPLR